MFRFKTDCRPDVLLVLLLGLGLASCGGGGGDSGAAPSNSGATTGQSATPAQPVLASGTRIMIFGDSISACCWADPLWTRLRAAGFTSIDFVGPHGNDNASDMSRDDDNNAWPGYAVSDLTHTAGSGSFANGYYGDARDVSLFFGSTTADVVLMHMGTNDRWGGVPPNEILAGYSVALNAMRARNPNVTLLVAQILPMAGPAAPGVDVTPLNNAIPAWAAANSTAQSPVTVVDMNTGFNSAWTIDGVHPNNNQTGRDFLVNRWYNALTAVLPR